MNDLRLDLLRCIDRIMVHSINLSIKNGITHHRIQLQFPSINFVFIITIILNAVNMPHVPAVGTTRTLQTNKWHFSAESRINIFQYPHSSLIKPFRSTFHGNILEQQLYFVLII